MPLYELHINIDPSQIAEAISYCKDKKYEYINLIAPDLKIREHFIVTKWKEGTREDAIGKIHILSKEFIQNGLRVQRLKVEEILTRESKEIEYIEFHFKVPIDCKEDLQSLRIICEDFGAKISYVLNKSHNPYVTIQLFDNNIGIGEIENALKIRAKFIQALKDAKLPTTEKMHSEAVIFDTNMEMDQ